jgi:ribonuclease J
VEVQILLSAPMKKREGLRLIPLGGLGEVGRNMTILEWQRQILVIDMGFRMPEESMPGIDYIIPNISYLKERKKDIVGVIFTHGHYDHIGAIPYINHKIGNPPLYASPLTKGIFMKRQEDFPDRPKLEVHEVYDGSNIRLGHFQIEFFHQNHNIMDNMGLFIQTPVGNILHTSDFKFDLTPLNDKPTDFRKIKEFANKKVLLLMSDSTGAENEGHSLSEKVIQENLETIFRTAKGRIITATFSSLIGRIQHILSLSEKYGRKVVVEGHSMRGNIEITRHLKYVNIKKNTIIKAKDSLSLPDEKVTILCTGAQGEGRAALMRIANKEHQSIKINKGDTIIFSSSVIPGNERSVQSLKDELLRQKAKVFHYKMMDIHAGGHAQREELKKMIDLTKPRFLMPIHGQYSMLVALKELAEEECNMSEKNIVLADNGDIIKLQPNSFDIEKNAVPSHYVMVDGLGVGDVGEVVLRDRQTLSQDGMFVIVAAVDHKTGKVKGSPDIISRGFIYLKESKSLLAQTRKKVIDTIHKTTSKDGSINWTYVKNEVRDSIGKFLFQKTERRPMVLPVIIEV